MLLLRAPAHRAHPERPRRTVNAFALVVCALAAWRVTRLVTEDTIADRPRDALLRRWNDRHPKLAELVTCPHCVGVYAAVLAVVAWAHWPWAHPVLDVAAVAAGVSLLATWEAK